MSLITCLECGCELSETAESCPSCGCPVSLFPKLERARSWESPFIPREESGFSLGAWGGESIRWRTLEADGNSIFAVAGKCLDCKPFNRSREQGNDWESSDLKAWLEQEFAKKAFTPRERALVSEVTCLSLDEVEEYFEDEEDRSCRPTAFACRQGALIDSTSGGCDWWLRSPGELGPEYAAYVFDDGYVDDTGSDVSDSCIAVRPALRLRLASDGLPASLFICPGCGRRISGYAEKCPGCGCPQSLFPKAVGNRFMMGSWDGRDIPWRTLKVEGNRILAISMLGLTCKPFNKNRYVSNDWDSSDLHRWLSIAFPLLAFSFEERAHISEVTCLTVEEAETLFADDEDRLCKPSACASREGVTLGRVTGGCDWWLRSPGLGGSDCATFVNFAGYIGRYGCDMNHTNVAVRPAVWLDL